MGDRRPTTARPPPTETAAASDYEEYETVKTYGRATVTQLEKGGAKLGYWLAASALFNAVGTHAHTPRAKHDLTERSG